MSIKCF